MINPLYPIRYLRKSATKLGASLNEPPGEERVVSVHQSVHSVLAKLITTHTWGSRTLLESISIASYNPATPINGHHMEQFCHVHFTERASLALSVSRLLRPRTRKTNCCCCYWGPKNKSLTRIFDYKSGSEEDPSWVGFVFSNRPLTQRGKFRQLGQLSDCVCLSILG